MLISLYLSSPPTAPSARSLQPKDASTSQCEEPKESFSPTAVIGAGVAALMNRRIPTTAPEVSQERKEEIQAMARPGDVLMSADMAYPGWGRMEHWTLGSRYTHAALMGHDGAVYEAVGEGVTKTTLEQFLSGRKKIAVARTGMSEDGVRTATQYAESQVGKPYDTAFDYSEEAGFYCSELVAKSLQAGQCPISIPMKSVFGKEAVAPDAFLKANGTQVLHDDDSGYWTNKVGYWPIAACTVGLGVAGGILGGPGAAALGSGIGFLSSVLVGNKIQTGHFSPSLTEIRGAK